jgi:hypothetical protein
MKVAILSESVADQAAVQVFVDALLGEAAELYGRPFRAHGWATVFNLLPGILNELHYNTDVDALAVVMDSDRTPPHAKEHDQPNGAVAACRLCRLRRVIRDVLGRLADTGRPPVKTAVGLAVPCIEAWFRCGHDNGVTEAAWLLALRENQFPYDGRRLKAAVYGSERVSLDHETRRMVEEARRLAADLAALGRWFPNGFGPFAADVRGWLPSTAADAGGATTAEPNDPGQPPEGA